MSVLSIISMIIWLSAITAAIFFKKNIVYQHQPVENPAERVFIVIALLSILAVVGWILAAPFIEIVYAKN